MTSYPHPVPDDDIEDGPPVMGVILLLSAVMFGGYLGFVLGLMVSVDRWYVATRGTLP